MLTCYSLLNIQTWHTSSFYFPFFVSIRWFSQQLGIWGFIQNQKGPSRVTDIFGNVGRGGLEVWSYQMQNNIQKSNKVLLIVQGTIFNIYWLTNKNIFKYVQLNHLAVQHNLRQHWRSVILQYSFLEKNKSVPWFSSHSLFLSFWLLLLVFSAENACSSPGFPKPGEDKTSLQENWRYHTDMWSEVD